MIYVTIHYSLSSELNVAGIQLWHYFNFWPIENNCIFNSAFQKCAGLRFDRVKYF